MNKLQALHALLEVADAGGFAKAAQRMGVATSSVTRLIDALEDELGTALLTRTPRKVSLTDTGEAYAEQVAKVLDDLAEADDSIADHGSMLTGSMRVSVPGVYNRLCLAAHLTDFLKEHPRLTLHVVAEDHYVDLAQARIDVVVRIGQMTQDPQLIARRLAGNPRYVVASPAYLAAAGVPQAPSDLAEHACLRFAYGGSYRARQVWTFQRSSERHRIDVRGRMTSNNADMLLAAVLGGQGMALLPAWLTREDMAAGRLVRLFADYAVTLHDDQEASVYAAYLPNRRHSSKVHALVQFLAARLTR